MRHQHWRVTRGFEAAILERTAPHRHPPVIAIAPLLLIQRGYQPFEQPAAVVTSLGVFDQALGVRHHAKHIAAVVQHACDRPARSVDVFGIAEGDETEEHTSEPQSLMRNWYAVFCLPKT